MICDPCKAQNHMECPTQSWGNSQHPTGLSEENNRIQLSGLCPCHHRVPFVKSDIGTEFVQALDMLGLVSVSVDEG